ncbi:MAG: putative motility protein [Proteobacteria bacterium]|nr:putative motility protein [Pseudomonadota bacterium]
MSSVGSLKGEAVQQAIDVAVLRKGLDVAEMQGEAAVELIENSGVDVAPPPVTPKSLHLGQLIDTYM